MPSTKDPLSEASSAFLAAHDAQQSAAISAAGAEIPVTIHASRYSAASKGGGKLPPVHEETRTVIILPQGAVVRLSAPVTPGELVVLTNNNTGADVICRVTNVKAQPGIQSYVHLEFTQRALDFWEESSTPGGRATSRPKPGMTSAPPSVTSTPTAGRTPVAPPQVERPMPAMSAADLKPVASALPVTALADAPIGDPMASLAKSLGAQSQQGPEAAPAPATTPSHPRLAPVHGSRLQPFEASFTPKRNTSTIILFAIAAVVLLVVGAVAGAILLRRDNGSTAVATQFSDPPAAVAPAPVPPAPSLAVSKPDAPSASTSAKANPPEPASPLPKNTALEFPVSQPLVAPAATEAPKAEVPAKTDPLGPRVTRPAINVGKISAPKVKKTAQLNSSEPPPILPPDAALPGVISEAASNPAAHASPLLPAPAVPAPIKGGQLQQPKLLSSVAAAYPPLARSQRVQGDVVIDALIDATGKVAETKVISGNSLLQKAAIDSLRQWKYQPAILNGQPIPVHLNVTIVFHLN
jgi:periplasmic protein TonB